MRVSYLKLLLIVLSSAAGAIAAPVEVGITPVFQSVENGQDFIVNISIDPANNPITGAQFNLLFNSSHIKIKNITEGNLFKQDGSNTTFSPGIQNNTEGVQNVWGLIITPGANVTAGGTLAEITMHAETTGISGLYLTNVIVSDPESHPAEVNITNGSVSVISKSDDGAGGGRSGGGSSSGGGGGGAGGTSGEDFNNIEIREKYDRFINKDIPASYCFRNASNPVICINITAGTSPGEVNTAVEVLRNTSSLAKVQAPDTVYKNINIWVGTYGFATPANIKHAEITFRVPVSWMEANSVDPDSITMARYEGAWQSLPTKKINETSEWIYYEASTRRFSPHAITGISSHRGKEEKISLGTGINEPQPTEKTEKQIITTGNEKEGTGDPGRYLIIGVFMGIALNATLYYRIIKPKRKDIFN